MIEEFKKPDSEILGLISCEVFTKGFDVPDVLCGISARPYRKSLSSHMQQLGRVMRASPGKEFGLWLDHTGNVLRFRDDVEDIFANGIRELDDGKREAKVRREPTPKEREEIRCSCGYMVMPWDRTCGGCGKERKRHSLVETQPGTMVELQGAGKKANKETSWAEKQRFYAGLKYYADDRGYADGWAARKYRERFGVWPNDPRVSKVRMLVPDSATLNWIKSRAIAWAKRRAAA